MKHCMSIALLLAGQAIGQVPSSSLVSMVEKEPTMAIVAKGGHHRVWEKTERVTVSGRERVIKKQFVELATGMHFFSEGEWHETQEAIVIQPDGTGAAVNGPHKAYVAANVNSPVSATVVTSDNKTLQTRILGLAFYDFKKKESVLLAELQDSEGILVENNRVLYPDAFDGGFKADVCFTYTRDGWEQDIIFRERPPLPEEFQFDPRTTWIEVWTEFIDAPEPEIEQNVRKGWQQSKVDKTVNFGAMRIPEGRAFGLDELPGKQGGLPVQKHWINAENRTFLVEEISFHTAAPKLRLLPSAAHAAAPKPKNVNRSIAQARRWPERKVAKINANEKIQVALGTMAPKGYVIDYPLTLVSGTNFKFKSDTTYYVSGTVNLSDVTTIEGGTVVKYTNGASVNILGSVNCLASDYRPAVFTSYLDNSLGEQIAYGTPSGTDASVVLSLANGGNLHHLRIKHASVGIASSLDYTVTHTQFLHCDKALQTENANFYTGNLLMYDVTNAFYGSAFHGTNEHVTLHQVGKVVDDAAYDPLVGGSLSSDLRLVNSLAIGVLSWGDFTPTLDGSESLAIDPGTIFQTVGGASHYLAEGSVYRDAGTTNINAALWADLQKKTTFPPVVYSNVTISAATTFRPITPRDNDVLDLGYHYDAMDFAFGGVEASTNLTFAAGTAAGWFRTSSGWEQSGYGIRMANTKIASFEGTADAPAYWLRCNTVQEESTGLWVGGFGPGGITTWSNQGTLNIALAAEVRFRFTRCSLLAGESGGHCRDDYGYLIVRAQDAEFVNGWMGTYVNSGYFTNCLMERVWNGQIEGWPGNAFVMRNCTLRGGSLHFDRWKTSLLVNVKDCAFDGTAFNVQDGIYGNPTYTKYDYNAFLTNAPSGGAPTSIHDVLVPDFNWQTLGWNNCYLPPDSPLLNAGSTNAAAAGLYHATTLTNQVKETNSLVDIGFHRMALANGVFFDTDGDGLADYLEDKDGDGVKDTLESGWTDADSDDDGLDDYWEWRQGRDPLKASTVNDTSGRFKVYTPLP